MLQPWGYNKVRRAQAWKIIGASVNITFMILIMQMRDLHGAILINGWAYLGNETEGICIIIVFNCRTTQPKNIMSGATHNINIQPGKSWYCTV